MIKNLVVIAGIGAISCCSAGKSSNSGNRQSSADTLVVGKEINYETDAGLPECIKKLIDQFKKEEKQNPSRSVYRYSYNGKTVYYVPAICCDFFSDLYDSTCKLIGHPDGGFTGRGDGTAVDFIQTRTNEKLIWKDERK